MVFLRSVVVMMLVNCGSAAMAAAAPRESASVVSIRIHDYSRAHARHLQQAQRLVSEAYARIGVRLDWRVLVRPSELEAGRGRWPKDGPTFVTVVILSTAMANRVNLPEGIAGYAPITRENGGRIAFVVGDRTRAIAARGRVAHSRVLAGVIAHELAHLLMPERSHSSEGVMRANWSPPEFRYIQLERFSEIEAASIREMARKMNGGPSSLAD
jgi:Zn-dependent protease with chaperone function